MKNELIEGASPDPNRVTRTFILVEVYDALRDRNEVLDHREIRVDHNVELPS